jgi:hypothetical protein
MDIKSTKGVTLTEVIAVVTIMLMIILPLSYVFTTAYTSFITESDKAAAQQAAREILYGKGFGYHGVMGDLERCNATSREIIVGGDTHDVAFSGQSISIPDDDTGGVIRYTFIPDSTNGGRLVYEKLDSESHLILSENYIGENWTNGKIIINDFSIQKIKRTDAGTDDNDKITVTVVVSCGKSGNITVESSYRLPEIEN